MKVKTTQTNLEITKKELQIISDFWRLLEEKFSFEMTDSDITYLMYVLDDLNKTGTTDTTCRLYDDENPDYTIVNNIIINVTAEEP